MTRRALGIAVLCLALLCSVLITKAGGIRVAGIAALPPGLDAPKVGNCLGSVSASMSAGSAAPSAAVSIDVIGETAVTFADCASEHLGEVVAFRRTPADTDAAGSGSATGGSDGEWCQRVALDYRSYSMYRLRDDAIGSWVPSTGQRFVAILSTPSSDPAESPWAACAVVSPELEAYRGSYLASFAQGPTPAPFGLCRSDDHADRWVSCVTPHRTQVFGTVTGQRASAAADSASCRGLIAGMTGMADISAGGALRLDVDGESSSAGGKSPGGAAVGSVNPATAGPTGEASCRLSVIGDAELVGTLIGVGQGRLPLG
jgi:hypothetical protein